MKKKFSFKLFPSSKIDFWPFLRLQKMDFGQKNCSSNWFIWFHEFFWPGHFFIFWPTVTWILFWNNFHSYDYLMQDKTRPKKSDKCELGKSNWWLIMKAKSIKKRRRIYSFFQFQLLSSPKKDLTSCLCVIWREWEW